MFKYYEKLKKYTKILKTVVKQPMNQRQNVQCVPDYYFTRILYWFIYRDEINILFSAVILTMQIHESA